MASLGRVGQYEKTDFVGSGAFGKVFKVQKSGCPDAVYALKEVPITNVPAADRADLLTEVNTLGQCQHFNIIKYHESFIRDECLHIVMEYADGGDLAQRIKAAGSTPFPEETLWNFLIQIAQGLEHLHAKRIIHRDLKPQNIFVTRSDNVKIGDMGLCKFLDSARYAHSLCGTPLYSPPEVINEVPYDDKADIWSFGCLMYELAMLQPPFMAKTPVALAKRILAEDPPRIPPERYSVELTLLIRKMLSKDPRRRPAVADILNYHAVRAQLQRAVLVRNERRALAQAEGLAKENARLREIVANTSAEALSGLSESRGVPAESGTSPGRLAQALDIIREKCPAALGRYEAAVPDFHPPGGGVRQVLDQATMTDPVVDVAWLLSMLRPLHPAGAFPSPCLPPDHSSEAKVGWPTFVSGTVDGTATPPATEVGAGNRGFDGGGAGTESPDASAMFLDGATKPHGPAADLLNVSAISVTSAATVGGGWESSLLASPAPAPSTDPNHAPEPHGTPGTCPARLPHPLSAVPVPTHAGTPSQPVETNASRAQQPPARSVSEDPAALSRASSGNSDGGSPRPRPPILLLPPDPVVVALPTPPTSPHAPEAPPPPLRWVDPGHAVTATPFPPQAVPASPPPSPPRSSAPPHTPPSLRLPPREAPLLPAPSGLGEAGPPTQPTGSPVASPVHSPAKTSPPFLPEEPLRAPDVALASVPDDHPRAPGQSPSPHTSLDGAVGSPARPSPSRAVPLAGAGGSPSPAAAPRAASPPTLGGIGARLPEAAGFEVVQVHSEDLVRAEHGPAGPRAGGVAGGPARALPSPARRRLSFSDDPGPAPAGPSAVGRRPAEPAPPPATAATPPPVGAAPGLQSSPGAAEWPWQQPPDLTQDTMDVSCSSVGQSPSAAKLQLLLQHLKHRRGRSPAARPATTEVRPAASPTPATGFDPPSSPVRTAQVAWDPNLRSPSRPTYSSSPVRDEARRASQGATQLAIQQHTAGLARLQAQLHQQPGGSSPPLKSPPRAQSLPPNPRRAVPASGCVGSGATAAGPPAMADTLEQVWVKYDDYPWWPAVVLRNGIEDVKEKRDRQVLKSIWPRKASDQRVVQFYRTADLTWAALTKLQRFDAALIDAFRQKVPKKDRAAWEAAVAEAQESMQPMDPDDDDQPCAVCDGLDDGDTMLLCDDCDAHYHCRCLEEPLSAVPEGSWFCPDCRPSKKAKARGQDPAWLEEEVEGSSPTTKRSKDDVLPSGLSSPTADPPSEAPSAADDEPPALSPTEPPPSSASSSPPPPPPPPGPAAPVPAAPEAPPGAAPAVSPERPAPRPHPASDWVAQCRFTFNDIEVKAQDVRRVLGKRWFNDTIIDWYMQCLQLRAKQCQREFFFAPTALQMAVLECPERCPRAAVRWFKDISLFEMRAIFIPICVERNHWATVCVLNPAGALRHYPGNAFPRAKRPAAMLYIDSLRRPRPLKVVEGIATFLHYRYAAERARAEGQAPAEHAGPLDPIQDILRKQKWSSLSPKTLIIRAKVPLQPNSYDCGVYLLHCVETMASKEYCRAVEGLLPTPMMLEQGRGMLDFPQTVIDEKRKAIHNALRSLALSGSKVFKVDGSDPLPPLLQALIKEDSTVMEHRRTLTAAAAPPPPAPAPAPAPA